MQIQVNTGNQIEATQELIDQIQDHLQQKLRRFESRITRLEVHLTDVNSSEKEGSDDKRCQIEARLKGLQPLSVTASDENVFQSVTQATRKLRSSLDSTLGKLEG